MFKYEACIVGSFSVWFFVRAWHSTARDAHCSITIRCKINERYIHRFRKDKVKIQKAGQIWMFSLSLIAGKFNHYTITRGTTVEEE